MSYVDKYSAIKFHNSDLEFRLGDMRKQPPDEKELVFTKEAFYQVAEKVNDFMLLHHSTLIKDIQFISLNIVYENNEVKVEEAVTGVMLDLTKYSPDKRKSIETEIFDFMRQRPDIPTISED